jgi:type IV pilus assembly protein PilE
MNRKTLPNRRARGFTLIEVLTVLGIASILSSIAWPSFQGSLQRARRADALVALTQVQLSQARWLANHRSYGSLADLRVGARSGAGHYALEMLAADGERYEVIARAVGPQSRDGECRHLKLVIDGAITSRSSGPDDAVANDPAANRRCWGL